MDFGKQLNKEIFEFLEEIKREFLLRIKEQEFFKFSIFPTNISIENSSDAQKAQTAVDKKRKILLKLADMGVVEIQPDTEEVNDFESEFLVKINLKKFTTIYNQVKRQKSFTSDTRLFTSDTPPQAEVGGLAVYSDGTIRYKGEVVVIRSQLKELCRLFIIHHNRLITIDEIKENLIAADRRQRTSFSTIAKYVSELHKVLRIHFKKDVIFNQKEEGWWFKS